MKPDLWSLYALMFKSRLFEEAIAKLWHDGTILGEMHLGTGEEGIIAGVVSQLREGDAMALDHRATAAMLMRGVDPVAILRECMGCSDGLCGGMGGHMHLFSKEHLAASSGIVGSEGPAAVGFALSAQYLRPGSIAVAFFGEGAVNQGMLMESMNLAAIWKLPVLFVCKDDGWAVATQSEKMNGENLQDRARGLGVPPMHVDGLDVAAVWEAARSAIERARAGGGPTFLQANCVHLQAHFLGFKLTRVSRHPLSEMPPILIPLAQSFLSPGGAPLRERIEGLKEALQVTRASSSDPRNDPSNDPVRRARDKLISEPGRLQALEDEIRQEIANLLAAAQVEVRP